MRSLFRVGIMLSVVVAAACNADPTPVDFQNPTTISSNLSSVDSAFNSDVFRSFNAAAFMIEPLTAPGMRPAAALLSTLRPKLERTGGHAFLPGMLQARALHALRPQLSVSAAQGAIIPDSLYGRVFEWNDIAVAYEFQDSTISNLNGVRFILYAVGLDGAVVEPVSAIGTLDLIDESTSSVLRLHVLVRSPSGAITYVDYTMDLQSSQTAVQATASGTITNGLSSPNNKTLSFDEAFTVNAGGVRVLATFALNNPAVSVLLNESVTFDDPNIIINADFRVVSEGRTIRVVGRITISELQNPVIDIAVQLDGHPVARISGDPTLPGTQWVDAGGEPLTAADLAALDDLFDALEDFDQMVSSIFAPLGAFAGL